MTIKEDRLGSARIGILDDEIANVELLERILGLAGFLVVQKWTDAEVALAALAAGPVDLLLLDLRMPRIDGFEVMARLWADEVGVGRTPVVVLTADTTDDARDRALGMGATGFLTKPFDANDVSLRIRNILIQHFLEVDLESQVRDRTAALRESLDHVRRLFEQRTVLVQRLVNAQEEERRRVAADIHDDTIQTMTAVGIRLELARRHAVGEELCRQLDWAIDAVHVATHGLRDLLFELHPVILDRDGLEAALRADVDRADAGTGAGSAPEVTLTVALEAEPEEETRVTVYRIAQEAIRNARRHSGAAHIRVEVRSDDGGIRLVVADDGRGVDPAFVARPRPGHLGLSAMRERAELAGGGWTLTSSAGAGTTIEAWIPVGFKRPTMPPELLADMGSWPAEGLATPADDDVEAVETGIAT
jgi:signal transduction histidine kinase